MPGGVINTGTHPKLLWPGIHAIWGQVNAEHPAEYPDLYDQESSDQAYEEDIELTGFPYASIKTEGGPPTYAGELQGSITRYMHIAWSLGWIVTYEELKDNKYEQVASRRARANAFSMNQTIEQIAAFLYNNAFATTYYTTGDGKAVVATDHLTPSGGTYSNALSPAADLAEASLEDLLIQVMQTKSNTGMAIPVMPRSLIVGPSEWFNANRILKSVLQSGTANNNINVLQATNAIPEGIKLNHYLTSPHAWFVRTNQPNGPMMFWRERPSLAQDNDFDTKNAKALSYMRLSVGVTDPRGIFGSNGP